MKIDKQTKIVEYLSLGVSSLPLLLIDGKVGRYHTRYGEGQAYSFLRTTLHVLIDSKQPVIAATHFPDKAGLGNR